ncbi:zinc ribbon domain-containing protein [[Clostridium] innocuum]|nr:zinc ribbon domain-containing protein [[Clostridium] innocuum]
MKCSNCESDINDDSKFCPICGNKVIQCHSCGNILKKENKFCPKCGNPLDIENNKDSVSSNDKMNHSEKKTNLNCNDYLILNKLTERQRSLLITICKFITYPLAFFVVILSLMYIVDAIKNEEGYKLSFYLVRYIYSFAKYILPVLLAEEAISILSIKKTELSTKYPYTLAIAIRIARIVFIILGIAPLLELSSIKALDILAIIADNSILQLILEFKFPIFMYLLAKGSDVLFISLFSIEANEKETGGV